MKNSLEQEPYPNKELLSSKEVVEYLAPKIKRVTEGAAVAAAKTRGMGDKLLSDQKAVEGMLHEYQQIPFQGLVVIGEGFKDGASQIPAGTRLGTGVGPRVDIGHDPLEGTELDAENKPGAVTVVAASEPGGLLSASDDVVYMDKIIVGPEAAGKIDIEAPVKHNLSVLAKSLKRNITDLTIVVLKRERNYELMQNIRNLGATLAIIDHGDLIPGLAACMEHSGVHAVMGIGGSPEGVLTAAAVKCLGGEMQVKWWPKNVQEIEKLTQAGLDYQKVYRHEDLVPGKWLVFSATAVTDNPIGLSRISFFGQGYLTNSLVLTRHEGLPGHIQKIEDIYRLDESKKIFI